MAKSQKTKDVMYTSDAMHDATSDATHDVSSDKKNDVINDVEVVLTSGCRRIERERVCGSNGNELSGTQRRQRRQRLLGGLYRHL